jgi:hypothetical protein
MEGAVFGHGQLGGAIRRTIDLAAGADEKKMNLKDLQDTPPWDWPVNAGDIVKESLRNPGTAASDRIIAAELAGDLIVMDDNMADLLLSIVRSSDEPEELRARAAISLGPVLEECDTEGFDDDLSEPSISEQMFHQIQQTLCEVHFDEGTPKQVRRKVLEASVRAAQSWHQDAVRAAYSREDEDWKLTAAFCMRWVPGFDDQILEMLESPNPDVHYEAVRAAGDREVDAAWPHIAALIAFERTEKTLLLAAIEAVANLRPREAGDVLADLADSEDEEIADAVSEALLMAEPGSDEDED